MEMKMFEEVNRAFDNASPYYSQGFPEQYEYDDFTDDDKLVTVNSEDLADLVFPRKDFIVSTLLSCGLCILAGAPKIGKSWFALHLCLQVAKGEPFLGMPVKESDVLYLALEDTAARISKRVNTITQTASPRLHITNTCESISGKFTRQIEEFVRDNPETRLVVIDTLQRIRSSGKEMSYSNDYSDMNIIKDLADELGICIMLVHHTRKMPDGDYMNVISGTNGLAGSADTLMVLQKEKRSSREATLSCTGRDIEDRELALTLRRDNCTWSVKSDSLSEISRPLPDELIKLIAYMKQKKEFIGSNSEFTESYNSFAGLSLTPSALKRQMNLHVDELEDSGVLFESLKSNGKRTLVIMYSSKHDKTDPEPEPGDGISDGDKSAPAT